MDALRRDVMHAVRGLARTPGFTLVALATLALAIGANAALFSVLDAVLLRALPFAEPERLYAIWSRHSSTDRYPFQLPEFCDYRDGTRSLEALAGFANWNANLTGDGEAERVPGLRVTGEFFELLGVRAALGRALEPADDAPGRERVVVLAHGLWLRRFGGDPGVVGRSVSLNGQPYEVKGVLPAGFLFPARGVELAIPLAPDADPWRHDRATTNFIRGLGRARAGASRAQVTADLEAIGERLRREFPDSYARKRGVLVVPLRDELTRTVAPTLWLLSGAVALLLAIACANLAHLLLVRATARRRELAIRQALGAGRGRLLGQLLTESALVALGGAALGLLAARLALPALVALAPAALPRAGEIQVDLTVLVFALAVTALATIAFGLLPALRAARSDPGTQLKPEGRGAGSVERARAGAWIVGGQVALMVVLLAAAGLLYGSFRRVLGVLPGFDPGALTLRLSLPRGQYAGREQVSAFYRALEARLRAQPGVDAVAAVNHVPLNGALASADYKVADRPPAREEQAPTTHYRMVTPDYFRAMGIPLLAGRAFREEDDAAHPAVAIVSQALARQSFPDRSPLGRQLLVQDNPDGFRPLEIVGVVGDVRHNGLESAFEAHLYVPYHQTHPALVGFLTGGQYLVVRPTAGDPLALAEAARRALREVDADVAAADVRASGFYVEAATATRGFALRLVALFGALALGLAALGIYGVAAYSVSVRERETGVRLALGARPAQIVSHVLAQGVRRTAAGLALGLLGALAVGRALRSQLYEVGAADPVTYASVVCLLLLVTLAACALPARRASRTDPIVALRRD